MNAELAGHLIVCSDFSSSAVCVAWHHSPASGLQLVGAGQLWFTLADRKGDWQYEILRDLLAFFMGGSHTLLHTGGALPVHLAIGCGLLGFTLAKLSIAYLTDESTI